MSGVNASDNGHAQYFSVTTALVRRARAMAMAQASRRERQEQSVPMHAQMLLT